MKLSEARDFIDRLYDAEGGMTADMREDLRRLHDSVDEQEGIRREEERKYDKSGEQSEKDREDERRGMERFEEREKRDKVDESKGMEQYWKEVHDKLDSISNEFRDFKRDYVRRVLSPNEAKREHEKDLKTGDFEREKTPEEIVKSIFKEEEIVK